MGLQRRLLLRAARVRMGQLVNRPGSLDPILEALVKLLARSFAVASVNSRPSGTSGV